MKRRRRLKIESLELRRCMTAFGFAEKPIAPNNAAALPSMIAADLDGDDDVDLLEGHRWRENDGKGSFAAPRLMFSQRNVTCLYAGDLDGDDDLDVVAASQRLDSPVASIEWFENLNGRGLLGPAQNITTDVIQQAITQLMGGDLDGDGDIDLIAGASFNQSTRLLENTNGRGQFKLTHTWNDLRNVAVSDVDRDGDLDLVGSQGTDLVLLTNDNSQFESKKILDRSGQLLISDLNQDGVLDFVLGEETGIQWYEFEPISTKLNLRETIRSLEEEYMTEIVGLSVGDLDGDGDTDLASLLTLNSPTSGYRLSAFQLKGATYQAIDGLPTNLHYPTFAVSDVNGDGLDEILSESKIYSLDLPTNRFLDPRLFADAQFNIPGVSELADLDGDGDLDAILSSWSDCVSGPGACGARITWHANGNGHGRFDARNTVWEGSTKSPEVIMTGDVDADGDLDILWNRADDPLSDLEWVENLDGKGSFGSPKILMQGVLLAIADIDQDGQADLLTKERAGYVAHFPLANLASGDQTLFFAIGTQSEPLKDWDHDGDLDIVVSDGRNFIWYENLGARKFAIARVILPKTPSRGEHRFYDIDGDGDFDHLWTPDTHARTVWQAQIDPNRWGPQQVISSDLFLAGAIDVDLDGDLDLLMHDNSSRSLAVNDGRGNFTMAPSAIPGSATQWADIDQDGDLDALGYSGAWYEQRLAGDSNGDGVFSSADLIAIFQAGEFEDWITGNSSFQTGDWNGDRDFDTHDLVFAFQAGRYDASRP